MRRLGSPHSNGTPKRGPECDITLAPSPDEPVIMGKQPLRLCASTPPQPSPAPTPSLELLGGGEGVLPTGHPGKLSIQTTL